VYIASGDNFPDALSAAPAAAASGGPLLLTPTNYEPAEIVAAITRLAPHRIVVVGGVNAVSADVFAAYGKLAPVIERISGADRYETSRLIAAAAFPVPVAPVAPTGAASAAVVGTRNAYLATGSNFPDALAASAAAGTLGEPVILVNGAATTVDAATSKLFTDLQIGHLRIAGGTAAVSAGLETALTGAGYSTERYAGATRYDTSVLINAIFDANNASGTVYLAVGTGYADALSGGALAAVDASPMFITPGNCVPVSVLQAILTLKATNVVLLGGPNALSASVADLIECE
jgi:putative cell wall-binding protein